MVDALTHYRTVSAGFDARVAAIRDDQWATPIPSCSDWDVRALVRHVVGNNQPRMLGAVDPEYDDLDAVTDLAAAWRSAHTAVLDALADPDTANREVTSPITGQTTTYAGFISGLICNDTLIHTWDLARALGTDEALNPDACAAVLDAMTPMDGAIRGPGRFADKIEPPAGADIQTRLLNFAGRAV